MIHSYFPKQRFDILTYLVHILYQSSMLMIVGLILVSWYLQTLSFPSCVTSEMVVIYQQMSVQCYVWHLGITRTTANWYLKYTENKIISRKQKQSKSLNLKITSARNVIKGIKIIKARPIRFHDVSVITEIITFALVSIFPETFSISSCF